jgi:hypothetical protein
MTVRITKDGRLPPEKIKVYIGICSRCGCEVEVDEADVRNPILVSSSKGSVDTGNIICPTPLCNSTIIVTERKDKIHQNHPV